MNKSISYIAALLSWIGGFIISHGYPAEGNLVWCIVSLYWSIHFFKHKEYAACVMYIGHLIVEIYGVINWYFYLTVI